MLPAPEPSHVLFIPEMLESILLKLVGHESFIDRTHTRGEQTVLLSQRVCRRWNDVIKASQELQQALYFKPMSSKTGGIAPSQNSHKANPLIQQIVKNKMYKYSCPCVQGSGQKNESPPASEEEAFVRKEASWRRMLVHQPPCSDIRGLVKQWLIGENTWSKAEYDGRDGLLRLGDLEAGVIVGKLVPPCCDLIFQEGSDPVPSLELWILLRHMQYDDISTSVEDVPRDCPVCEAFNRTRYVHFNRLHVTE